MTPIRGTTGAGGLTVIPLDDARWLVGPEGAARLAELDPHAAPTPALVDRLRRTLSPARTHLLIEQIELRRRARDKFVAAGRMFFSRVGLEQATDDWLAHYKSGRFAARGAVVDLCCGIGGDLRALARRGGVLGFERDAATATLAEANLIACNGNSMIRSEVRIADAAEFDPSEWDGWHIDPDRRPRGRRTTRAELHDPGPEAIERLLGLCPRGAVKLSPAAMAPPGWEERAEWEWISRGGQCRQLVLWFDGLTDRPGSRRATILPTTDDPAMLGTRGAVMVRSISASAGAKAESRNHVGRYLFEPDPAVLAAGLADVLAIECGLQSVTAGNAYLTGDAPVADSALACFEIRETLPFDVRRLRAVLRARGVGTLEIKKRGLAMNPAELRARLDLKGDAAATLIVTKVNGRATALLGKRILTTSVVKNVLPDMM
jgi:hypothetical protein